MDSRWSSVSLVLVFNSAEYLKADESKEDETDFRMSVHMLLL